MFLVAGRAVVMAATPMLESSGVVNVPLLHELWSRHDPALVWDRLRARRHGRREGSAMDRHACGHPARRDREPLTATARA